MIDVTPAAAVRIQGMLKENNVSGGLRLGVVGGGCSGLSYKFKFESEPRPADQFLHIISHSPVSQRLSPFRRPQAGQVIIPVPKIPHHGPLRPLGEGHLTLFLPLPMPYPHAATLPIQVGRIQQR